MLLLVLDLGTEPLDLELLDGAVVLELGKRGVDGLGQAGVVLGDDDAVLLARRDLDGDLAVGEGVRAEVLHHGQVGGSGVVEAGLDARDGGHGVVERLDGGLGEVLLRPCLAGGEYLMLGVRGT